MFHEAHQLRHPLAQFNVAFEEMVSKTLRVARLVESARETLPHLDSNSGGWRSELADATDQYLDALVQYYDGLKSVLCCFYRDLRASVAKKALSGLARDMKRFRDPVAEIVNLIKHKQRVVRLLYFHAPGVFVPGYFIEGPFPGGAVGPDPKIHDGGNTAISYNRDLPLQICGVYFAAASLAGRIRRSVAGVGVPEIDPVSFGDNLSELMTTVSRMPLTVFSDEASKGTPLLKYVREVGKDGGRGVLEYPAQRLSASAVSPDARITVLWQRDGVSREYRLPYFRA